MDKAITRLEQKLSAPSNDELQTLGMCHICWTDYEGEDYPVKLPCGHVFGKECILVWARGTTPSGSYNGCPWCGTELLPPSLSSRFNRLQIGVRLRIVVRVAEKFGVLGFLILWTFISLLRLLPESHTRAELELLMIMLLLIHGTLTAVSLVGWQWRPIFMCWVGVVIIFVAKTILG